MKKGVFYAVLAVSLTAAVFTLPILNSRANRIYEDTTTSKVSKSSMVIVNSNKNEESNHDSKKVNTTSSYIVRLDSNSLVDYAQSAHYNNVAALLMSSDSREYYDSIKKSQAIVKASVQKIIPESDFTDSFTYSAVFNGFSVKIPDSQYDKLTKINGVKSVMKSTIEQYISADENPNQSTVKKLSSPSTSLIGADAVYQKGLTGNGMLISVLDDEFDCTHSAFSALPESPKYTEEQLNQMFGKVAFNVGTATTFKDAYKGGKIAFAYDYADRDNDTYCDANSHGTEVASLIAGNNGKTDAAQFRGTAYNAQLALMKVAHDSDVGEGKITSLCAVLAAFDDSVKLGSDIIHCSFGSPQGIENCAIYSEVVSTVESMGISVVTSAGNSAYNGSEMTDQSLSPKDIDYGTVNDIGLLESALTVASADNPQKIERKFTANQNTDFSYTDIPSVDENGNIDYSATTLSQKLNTSEYVYLGNGTEADYADTNAYGKIAVVQKNDDYPLNMQVNTAYDKGAVAVMVIHQAENDDRYTVESAPIPMISVDNAAVDYFTTYPNGSVVIDVTEYVNATDTQLRMSSSSSYGVASDLTLKPDITAVGGEVYSGINNDRYATVSGTSMAAASTSGAVAVLKNYFAGQSALSAMSVTEQKQVLNALMLSNADVLKQPDTTSLAPLYVTPRLQGAGMVNLNRATSSEAYVTVEDGSAKIKLGESDSGTYEFTATVHNFSAKARKFDLTTALQTDAYQADENGQLINTLTPYSLNEGAVVEATADGKKSNSIIVNANSEKAFTVRITLDSSTVLAYRSVFTNGFYVDGYLFLTEAGGTVLNAPMLGYCGTVSAMNLFDSTDYDSSPAITGLSNTLVAVSNNDDENNAYTLGYNHFTKQYDGDISIGTNTSRNYNDNTQIGNSYILPNFHLMRNAYNYTVSISDLNGTMLFSCNYGTVGHYRSNESEPYQELMDKSASLQNFFATLGEGEYIYTVTASVKGADEEGETYSKAFHFTVDNTVPTDVSGKTYTKGDKIYLELSAKDEKALQGFELCTAAYHSSTGKYDYADPLDSLVEAKLISDKAYILNSVTDNSDGSVTYLYDITELRNQLTRISKYGVGMSVVPSTLKIAYKAVDYAFNATSAYTVDTIMLGSAEFDFVDQNGKPIEGLKITLDGVEKTTDKNGKIVYNQLVPAMYTAEIVSVPEDYTSSNEVYIVGISETNLKYQSKSVLKFTGQYRTQEEESSAVESSAEESSAAEQSKMPTENSVDKNPFFGLSFVGILLVIGIIALIVSRQRKR